MGTRHSLKTNAWNLKMDPWKRRFLLEITIISRSSQPLIFWGGGCTPSKTNGGNLEPQVMEFSGVIFRFQTLVFGGIYLPCDFEDSGVQKNRSSFRIAKKITSNPWLLSLPNITGFGLMYLFIPLDMVQLVVPTFCCFGTIF